jgi:hypothetical protein
LIRLKVGSAHSPNELSLDTGAPMTPQQLAPGDFILVRSGGVVGWLIRAITRSPVNHAAIVRDDDTVLEARSRGAVFTNWKKYASRVGVDVVGTARLPLTSEQRARVPEVAEQLEGIPYSFLDLLSVGALQYHVRIWPLRAIVARENRAICSQLVDEFLQRLGFSIYSDGRWPGDVTPGDLLWTAVLRNWVT